MVGTSALVARRRARSTTHSSPESTTIPAASHHSTTASSDAALQSCTGARTLCHSFSTPYRNYWFDFDAQQDDLVGRKYSNALQIGHHSGAKSDSRLAHGQDPDSGSTAWLGSDCQSRQFVPSIEDRHRRSYFPWFEDADSHWTHVLQRSELKSRLEQIQSCWHHTGLFT